MYIPYSLHQFLQTLALVFPAFLLIFTVKGFFRALVAYMMGDETPYVAGFVSLNPLAHINLPTFLLLAALLSLPGFNIAILFVLIFVLPFFGQPWYSPPVNHRNFHWYYLGVVLIALSETIACILLAFLCLLFLQNVPTMINDAKLLIPFIQISQHTIEYALGFAALHLIPIPPLSASDIWLLGGEDGEELIRQIEPFGFLVLLVFLLVPGINSFAVSFFSTFIFTVKSFLISLIG